VAGLDQNGGIKYIAERLEEQPRERVAERFTAAAYGTVLVIAALPLLDADEVSSGLGWELVTGVGVATWVAHLYAEAIGDHLRRGAALDRAELKRAMADGLPILLAAVPPALVLLVGRLGGLSGGTALWLAVAIALAQLIGLGVLVGSLVSIRGRGALAYTIATVAIGVVVVGVKLALGH
jgi:hypothetical protein